MPTALSPELQQVVRAQGSVAVENPGGGVAYYGYRDDHPNLVPALGSKHGDNVTYEIVRQNRDRSRDGLEDDDDRW